MTKVTDKAKIVRRLLESSVLWEDEADGFYDDGRDADALGAMLVSKVLNNFIKRIDEGEFDLVDTIDYAKV